MKKILNIIILLTFIFHTMGQVSAQTIDQCEQDSVKAIGQVLYGDGKSPIRGYLRQLDDLTKTGIPVYQLLEEIEELARNLRIEVRGICSEVGKFQAMDRFVSAAYGLESCRTLPEAATQDAGRVTKVSEVCFREAEKSLEAFLTRESLNTFLVQETIRVASDPLVNRLRSLNAKLTVLLSDYSRLINNFFTFSFRLGGKITGEKD